MGARLTLLPLGGPEEMGYKSVSCFDLLSFDKDYDIFGQLNYRAGGGKPTIKAKPIPPQMSVVTYDDDGIRHICEDNYGDRLTFVYAKQLKRLKMGDTTPKNHAIKAFINALPDDIPIILLWE